MKRLVPGLFAVVLAFVPTSNALVGAAPLVPGDIALASTSDSGVKGNANSFDAALSADGTTTAFTSNATNLDAADTEGLHDVYVKNLLTGDITLASTSDTGAKGNGLSAFPPALSYDGTIVAFSSRATNLDPADTDSEMDIYVKNLVTGDITLASSSDTGAKGIGAGDTAGPASLSADGTIVAFISSARNFDLSDSAVSDPDVYVKNLVTGDITLASTSDTGVKPAFAGYWAPSLSADGTKVAFGSTATNLDPADTDGFFDIYVKDLVTGDITLASTSDAGVKADVASIAPSLSADGTKVAFSSDATNLDPVDGDSNPDIYVKDLVTGDITLASTSGSGVNGDGFSFGPSLSADGARVAFVSESANLDPADTDTTRDVYVKDLATGDLTLASTSDSDVKGNDDSECACRFTYPGSLSLSADGTKVAFQSLATNLDPADTDALVDVYVKTLSELPNSTPVGTHDAFEGEAGPFFCAAAGWAVDPDDPYADLNIRILSDGAEVASGVANLFRQDLLDAGVSPDGISAFHINLWGLVSLNVPHLISAQAQDAQTAEWADLDGTPKELTCVASTVESPNPKLAFFTADCLFRGTVFLESVFFADDNPNGGSTSAFGVIGENTMFIAFTGGTDKQADDICLFGWTGGWEPQPPWNGTFLANVFVTPNEVPPAPGNDVRRRALPIALGEVATLNTSGARVSRTDPKDCPAEPMPPSGHTVWYSFTAPADGSYEVNTIGSEYDTTLFVLAPGGSVVGCDDDIVPTVEQDSQLTFAASAGTTYLIMVGSYDGSRGGNLVLTVIPG